MTAVFQPAAAAGLTHASTVIPLVRSSGLLAMCGTVTQLVVPLNASAPPNLPATCVVAAPVPLVATGDESMAASPLGSSKPRARTSPSTPSDTRIATAAPAVSCVPAAGVVLTMLPAAMVGLLTNVIAPTVSPTSVIAVAAAARGRPTTLGTMLARPSDTTTATELPGAALDPAAGVWLMIAPAGTVVLAAFVTAPTVRFAGANVTLAADTVCPTTLGTSVPIETRNDTTLPIVTLVPGSGVWLMTMPIAMVVLLALVATGTRPEPLIVSVAATLVAPVTFGTEIRPMLAVGTVTSENCSCSMLRSLSTPSRMFGLPAAGPLSVTVTIPVRAFRTMVYSDSGPRNMAVSQFFGAAAPQSGAGTLAGVTSVRTIVMLPGFRRCGAANTSSTRSSGLSTSLTVPSFSTALNWTFNQTSPSMMSSPPLPSRTSLPAPPSRMSPPMNPTPLMRGMAGESRSVPNTSMNAASPVMRFAPALVSSMPTIRHSATSAAAGSHSTLLEPAM